MRYKTQALNLVEKLENLINQLEQTINRNESRDSALAVVEKIKERMEQLRSQISIEPGEFLTSA